MITGIITLGVWALIIKFVIELISGSEKKIPLKKQVIGGLITGVITSFFLWLYFCQWELLLHIIVTVGFIYLVLIGLFGVKF